MKNIRLILKEEEHILEEIEIKYLFPYLFRFDNNNGTLLLDEGITKLSGDSLIEFKKYISKALCDLLSDCYIEPPIKRRQKHPTFYEKIEFKGAKYVLDYTTSILGRLMYTLYLRVTFVDKAIQFGVDLTIIISK